MKIKLIPSEKPRFLTRVIQASIRSVMLYTVATFAMVWMTGNAPPDALTIAFFAYWSFENGAAALIRIKEKLEEREKEKAQNEEEQQHELD